MKGKLEKLICCTISQFFPIQKLRKPLKFLTQHQLAFGIMTIARSLLYNNLLTYTGTFCEKKSYISKKRDPFFIKKKSKSRRPKALIHYNMTVSYKSFQGTRQLRKVKNYIHPFDHPNLSSFPFESELVVRALRMLYLGQDKALLKTW